jgi:hypothetical protein
VARKSECPDENIESTSTVIFVALALGRGIQLIEIFSIGWSSQFIQFPFVDISFCWLIFRWGS